MEAGSFLERWLLLTIFEHHLGLRMRIALGENDCFAKKTEKLFLAKAPLRIAAVGSELVNAVPLSASPRCGACTATLLLVLGAAKGTSGNCAPCGHGMGKHRAGSGFLSLIRSLATGKS